MPNNKGKKQPAGVGMVPSKTVLGEFMRARRLELDMRQVELNRLIPRSGYQNSLVSRIETGKQKTLGQEQLKAAAKALQVEVEELRKRMEVKPRRPGLQPKTKLGRLIRSRREELGLSLPAFAKRMNIAPKRASALEMRRGATTRYEMIQRLASALDLSPSIFVPFVATKEKESKSEFGRLARSRRKEFELMAKISCRI